MSVVKINVLDVPAERAEMLEERFRNRAGAIEDTPGFESFELLRPTGDSTRWYVYTRWESEEAFTNWRESQQFEEGHAGERHGPPAASGSELLEFEVVLEAEAR